MRGGVITAAGGHDHDGRILLMGRGEHRRARLAALSTGGGQLDDRHPREVPAEPTSRGTEQYPMNAIHGFEGKVRRHGRKRN